MRTSSSDKEVEFPHPAGVEVEVQKTVVIAHQHTPRGEGPPQERGHHLIARQHVASGDYVACLTWGIVGERLPEITARTISNEKISVTLGNAGRSMVLAMTAQGGTLEPRSATRFLNRDSPFPVMKSYAEFRIMPSDRL